MGTVLFFGLGGLVVAALTGVLTQFFGRYVYSCRLSERGVDFRLFGLVLFWRIPFRDIVDAREVGSGEFSVRESGVSLSDFRLLRFGNRILGGGVIIERVRGGIARWIAITPDNPAEFIAELRGRITPKSID